MILAATLVSVGTVIGILPSNSVVGESTPQVPPPAPSGEALWHLPKFSETGWFLHNNNGRVIRTSSVL
jgi:hypothetical protein